MMDSNVYIIGFGLLLIISLSPFYHKAFEKCYHPVLRRPASTSLRDALALIILSFGFTFLYAVSSGSVSNLVNGNIPARETLLTGALLGTLVFGAARIWALFYSHSFAQSIYFSTVLAIAAYLSIGFFFSDVPTFLADSILKGDRDDLRLLPQIFGYSFIGWGVSEVLSKISDKWFVSDASIISYSLVREQLEIFEHYPRISDRSEVIIRMRRELQRAMKRCNSKGEQLIIRWLSGNASPEVRTEIQLAVNGISKDIPVPIIRIICHRNENNIADLANFPFADTHYFEFSGSTRLLIIQSSTTFLGIQMGGERHEYFPDYVFVIKDPIRISQQIAIFDNCWEIAKP